MTSDLRLQVDVNGHAHFCSMTREGQIVQLFSCVLYNMYVYLYMHTMYMYMYMYLEVYHSLPSTLFFLTSLLPACQGSELITHRPLPPSDELTSPVLSFITQEHYNPLRLVHSVHSSLAALNKVPRRSFLLTTGIQNWLVLF